MIIIFSKKLTSFITSSIFVCSLISLKSYPLKADDLPKPEFLSEDIQIDSSTKTEGDKSSIPTNPFEIVEMIRRNNSLNNATNPSDAIDDALKSFNSLKGKSEI